MPTRASATAELVPPQGVVLLLESPQDGEHTRTVFEEAGPYRAPSRYMRLVRFEDLLLQALLLVSA